MFEYVGALHIHSVFSDGSGTVQEIMHAAKEARLDYIMLTDHNTLRALDEGLEGWYGKTLLIVGCEINDKQNLNHYLAFGLKKTLSTRIPAKEYVKKVKDSGGIGFIAHPFENRSSMKEHPPYPWTEWDSNDFTGMEIWNHMSEWMEGLTEQNKYNHFVHPLRSIISPTSQTLRKWDELNLERKVVGIGGIDAHAHKVNLLGFFEVEVFSYKVLFKSIRTHILLNKKISRTKTKQAIERTKQSVFEAYQRGRCFISNYYHGDATGFRFFAESENKIFQMGDSIPKSKNVKLRVILPNISGTINFIHNGKKIETVDNIDAELLVNNSGVYRVEVYLGENAWIFSNHIRIGL